MHGVAERFEPDLFSEHLAWSTHDGAYLNDLLPLPYTEATLGVVVRHIEKVQQTLGVRMLLENPVDLCRVRGKHHRRRREFLARACRAHGCGLLLDVNNVYVSAVNHGFDPAAYIDRFPVERSARSTSPATPTTATMRATRLLIDAHGSRVPTLSGRSTPTRCRGPVRSRPTLIEWDNDVPPFAMLLAEAVRAERMISAQTAQPVAGARGIGQRQWRSA